MIGWKCEEWVVRNGSSLGDFSVTPSSRTRDDKLHAHDRDASRVRIRHAYANRKTAKPETYSFFCKTFFFLAIGGK